MSEASGYLVGLAGRISAAYVEVTEPRAVLLTGSAAEGVSDYFSDLDIIVYHDRLPAEGRMLEVRDIGSARRMPVQRGVMRLIRA